MAFDWDTPAEDINLDEIDDTPAPATNGHSGDVDESQLAEYEPPSDDDAPSDDDVPFDDEAVEVDVSRLDDRSADDDDRGLNSSPTIEAFHPDTGEPYDLWHPDFDKEGRLEAILHQSYLSDGSEYSLLGACLARCAAAVSHNHKLPPVGGVANALGAVSPLCFYVCLVLESGGGKSEAITVSDQLLNFGEHSYKTTRQTNPHFDDHNLMKQPIQAYIRPSSGEAIPEAFIRPVTYEREKSRDPDGTIETEEVTERHPVLNRMLSVWPEIGQMLKVAARQNNPLPDIQRQSWAGEDLITTTSQGDTTRSVPAGSYTIGQIVAAQLEPAAQLLSQTSLGDAQRFLFLAQSAAWKKDIADAAANAAMMDRRRHEEGKPAKLQDGFDIEQPELPPLSRQDQHCLIAVPDEIVDLTKRFRADVSRPGGDDERPRLTADEITMMKRVGVISDREGRPDVVHGNLMRSRIATLVHFLCGNGIQETPESWIWAGALMTVHKQTCDWILDESARREAIEAEKRHQAKIRQTLDTDERKAARRAEKENGAQRVIASRIMKRAMKEGKSRGKVSKAKFEMTRKAAQACCGGVSKTLTQAELGKPKEQVIDEVISMLVEKGVFDEGATDNHWLLTDSGKKRCRELENGDETALDYLLDEID